MYVYCVAMLGHNTMGAQTKQIFIVIIIVVFVAVFESSVSFPFSCLLWFCFISLYFIFATAEISQTLIGLYLHLQYPKRLLMLFFCWQTWGSTFQIEIATICGDTRVLYGAVSKIPASAFLSNLQNCKNNNSKTYQIPLTKWPMYRMSWAPYAL